MIAHASTKRCTSKLIPSRVLEQSIPRPKEDRGPGLNRTEGQDCQPEQSDSSNPLPDSAVLRSALDTSAPGLAFPSRLSRDEHPASPDRRAHSETRRVAPRRDHRLRPSQQAPVWQTPSPRTQPLRSSPE